MHEGRCHDYYIRHVSTRRLKTIKFKSGSKKRVEGSYAKDVVMCRLCEWKRKHGTCPYDLNIKAQSKVKPGQTILPGQKTL